MYKDFNTILNQLFTDHQNACGSPPGLLSRIKYTALASALWGLYRFVQLVSDQIFPDTCSSVNLVKHAARKGINQQPGESDASLLARLAYAEQKPLAGGNKYDWPMWAKESYVTHVQSTGSWVERAKAVWVYEHKRSLGSIDVIVSGDHSLAPLWEASVVYDAGSYVRWGTESYVTSAGGTSAGSDPTDDSGVAWVNASEIPSTVLMDNVNANLNLKRPIGLGWNYVTVAPTRRVVNVTITVSGAGMEESEAREILRISIYEYLKYPIEKKLLVAQLIAMAIDAGADDVTDIAPATTVTPITGPAVYERVWPGTIIVQLEGAQ